jgi:plastocyanin
MRQECSLVKTFSIAAAGAVAAVVCAIALSAGGLSRASASESSGPAAREIHVVARGMTFYVDGRPEANPALRLRRGERVRIVFRNEDPGMKHDFVIPDWAVETKTLSGKGETSIAFSVPERATSGTYACTPHAAMMKGTIAVE